MPGLRPPGFGDIRPKPETQLPYSVDNAKAKAEDFLKRNYILEGDFVKLYGPDNVERDLVEVYEKREVFKKKDEEAGPLRVESAKLATILEAILYSQINNAQWFGPYTKAIKASEYDDIKHGVDGILEINQPKLSPNYVALGIDVTFSSRSIETKFNDIKDEIEKGHLTTIKYLKTKDYQGQKANVPRLIVAVDGPTIHGLAQVWYKDAPGLKDNIIRYQILKELIDQLEVFEAYARKVGQIEVADRYVEARYILLPLFSSVQKHFSHYKHELTDRAYEEMKRQLDQF